MSLNSAQALEVISLAIDAWKGTFGGGVMLPQDYQIRVDKPNSKSLCSLIITSNRTDDNFRMKLYVMSFNNFTLVDRFILTQEQGYGPGKNDEVFVADCQLNRVEYMDFYRYLMSSQFQQDVIDDQDLIHSESEADTVFIAEDGTRLALEF